MRSLGYLFLTFLLAAIWRRKVSADFWAAGW
jgi:hypothetical protein